MKMAPWSRNRSAITAGKPSAGTTPASTSFYIAVRPQSARRPLSQNWLQRGHTAFDQPPLTRRDRVANVRKRDVFTQYGPQARAVLEALLDKYQDGVVTGLDDPRLLQIAPFASMGTVPQLIKHFGTRADFERAVHALQTALYQESA